MSYLGLEVGTRYLKAARYVAAASAQTGPSSSSSSSSSSAASSKKRGPVLDLVNDMLGRAEMIFTRNGERETPAYAAVSGSGEQLFAESAFVHALRNESSTAYALLRFVGLSWSEPACQEAVRAVRCSVVEASGRPSFSLADGTLLSPEDALAGNLAVLRSEMEDAVGSGNLKGVVVAVAGSLSPAQQDAVLAAVRQSGIPVVGCVDTAVAAAISAGVDRMPAEDRELREARWFVVVEAGVRVRATLLRATSSGLLRVVSSQDGEPGVGGDELDELLVRYFADDFQRKERASLASDRRALAKLRKASEQAKRALSQAAQTTLDVESLHDGSDYSGPINRGRLELLAGPALARWQQPVVRLLEAASLGHADLAGYVLTGGCSSIQVVRQAFEALLPSVPCLPATPEAAVCGAALQALILQTHPTLFPQQQGAVAPVKTAPRSVGLSGADGQFHLLIPAGHPLPATVIRDFATSVDNQTSVVLRLRDELNTALGRVVIDNLPPLPATHITVRISFRLDLSGDLQVLATSFDPDRTPLNTVSFIV